MAEASSQNLSGAQKGSILHTHPHSLGWTHSCGQHAWHGCCCLLVCSPGCAPPECPGSLSSHRAHFSSEPPLGLWETLGASYVPCVVLCPLTVLTQRIGPPLPSIPPVVTSGVVQDGCPFLPAFSLCPWTLEAC